MQAKKTIRVATRPSKLAVTQTNQTVASLQAANPDIIFEVIEFSTQGDRNHTSSLTAFGGTGVFVKELEQAMLDRKADIAIHSLKDVPSDQPAELVLASFPKREDSRDVFISRNGTSIEEMPEGFKLGTGSPRRVVQLKSIRPDAEFAEIRGNIDTRIKKLQDGEYDAIILAQAGMNRLGNMPDGAIPLSIDLCLPAVGQGCIGIECRSNDTEVIEAVRRINDVDTEDCVLAERAFMSTVEGGCKFPLAAFAQCREQQIVLQAIIGDKRSNRFMKAEMSFQRDVAVESARSFAFDFKKSCENAGIDCTAE